MFARIRQRDLARRDGVEIRYYTIIYDVIDDMRAALLSRKDIWPTDTAPVIRQLDDATTEFAQLRWGFTPPRPKGAPASARSTDPIPPGHISEKPQAGDRDVTFLPESLLRVPSLCRA
jgi:putative SOS response-associated peptidase YedK